MGRHVREAHHPSPEEPLPSGQLERLQEQVVFPRVRQTNQHLLVEAYVLHKVRLNALSKVSARQKDVDTRIGPYSNKIVHI